MALAICVVMAISLILLGVFLLFVAIVQAGSTHRGKSCTGLIVTGVVTILIGVFIGYVTWMEIDETAYAENARTEADLRIIR